MKHILLNNEVIQRSSTGELQFNAEKDKEAAREYFLNTVNKKTVFFHTLKEKLKYLIEEDYYDKELLKLYNYEEIKSVYELVYSYKFRFPSYMSAFKFYNDYALQTNDKKNFLERYEDRISIVSLFLASSVKYNENTKTLQYVGGDVEKAKDYAKSMIEQRFQPATPTFLNAGRSRRGELVSCFLLEMPDSLNGINAIESQARHLSKVGGGVSINLTPTRAKGETLMGIENTTSGVVPIMKSLDQSFRHIDQAGMRQGAGVTYLNIFHADIQDFLETKKISADEDYRVKTLSTGVVIPDKFIELAKKDEPMYTFYPKNVADVTGKELNDYDLTKDYEYLANHPDIRKNKINPRTLLEQIAVTRVESGYPYIMFQDNVNSTHPNNNISKVKFTNLCVEVLNASIISEYGDYNEKDDIGLDISCNLGSLNIKNVMNSGDIYESVSIGMDGLTSVTDFTNIENAPGIKKANDLLRSVGLGVMNLHGYLASVGIAYESKEAIEFVDVFFEAMNFASIKRSNELAIERNSKYYDFENSTYADGSYFKQYIKGERPIERASEKVFELFEGFELPSNEEWAELMKSVQEYGLYHAYRLATPPTGSISYIQSATASVMPIMERIEERTYGNSKTYYPMPNLSNQTWFYYKEAYDMDMYKVIDLISTIQKHIDQGISFTLFVKDNMTTRDMTKMYLYAHHKKIKTIYYQRLREDEVGGCTSCVV